MSATVEAMLKIAQQEIEELRRREIVGADAYRALKARADALENDQHGVVAEASRQVATSDALVRRTCGALRAFMDAASTSPQMDGSVTITGWNPTKLNAAHEQARIALGNSTPPPPTAGLSGVLVRAGTFVASGEEVTGYVVSTTRDELSAVPRLPMYKRVHITEATP